MLARKQSAVEKLQKQVQAEREETRRTKEELGNLRSAAEEMVRGHQQHTAAACHLALILCPVVAGGELPGSER